MDDLIQQAADEQRRDIDAVMAGEPTAVGRAAGMAGVAAADAAEGWTSMAEDLKAAMVLTSDVQQRRALRRAASKAASVAKIAASMRRDLDRVVELGRSNDGR